MDVRKAVGSTGAEPGDTVWIRRGTYNGAVNFTGSGNAGAWITFRAYQGELPIIQGSGGSGVSSSSAQYVRFVGVAVRNFSSSGFGNGWVDNTGTSNGNLQFINCIADNNGINGIAFYNASGILIENSIIAPEHPAPAALDPATRLPAARARSATAARTGGAWRVSRSRWRYWCDAGGGPDENGGKSTRTSRGPRRCRMGENTCAAREVRV